ncbi:MAG: hypothetical protein OXI81_00280 [Paracoccaceae bacterium]|nr:hypothetical protein [Paracoccaceae bacterium]
MAMEKRGILAIRRAFVRIVSFPYCTAPIGAVARSHVACPESTVVAPIRPFAPAARLGDLRREGVAALNGPVPSACADPGMAAGA